MSVDRLEIEFSVYELETAVANMIRIVSDADPEAGEILSEQYPEIVDCRNKLNDVIAVLIDVP